MSYPYAAPDAFDYLLWPDNSAGGEQTSAWTWTAGYAQQEGRVDENITFEDLVAASGWEQNAPIPANENLLFKDIPVSTFDFGYETEESLHSP